MHSQHEDITWLREIETCKVTGPDGYQYHPVWLHPSEAETRGIKHGDIVSIFNERGTVLAGAYVTERIMPGVVYIDHGAKWDPIVPGEIDRGGAINTIVPRNTTSKNAVGHAVSGFLVDVEKTDLEELKRKYPEAFAKPFHPCAGPGLEACIWREVRDGQGTGHRSTTSATAATTARWPARTSTSATTGRPSPSRSPTRASSGTRSYDNVRGQVPKVKVTYKHSICQHCDDAPCIAACNVDAIYKRDDGIVIIDPDKCRGNQLCMEACPYENVIYFNDSLNIAQKCTFCAHLLDDGWTEPRCVGRLPHRRLHLRRRGRSHDQGAHRQGRAAQARARHVKPRVYYIGLPKTFIAGAVFDPEADECTEGATVTATNVGNRRKATRPPPTATATSGSTTWSPASTRCSSRRPATCRRRWAPSTPRKDINVGDIAVWKA